jgi:hypothetical protein
VGSPRDLKQDGGQPYLTRELATFIIINKSDNFRRISDWNNWEPGSKLSIPEARKLYMKTKNKVPYIKHRVM